MFGDILKLVGGVTGLGAITGALGGAIAGGRGTRDQNQITSFGPAGPEEQQLQQQAMQQYLQQIGLLGGVDQNVNDLDPIRQQALQQQIGVLNGSAFLPTEQEQSQIENLRQQQIGQGTHDIERLLGDRIGQVANSAGVRGLRGQAYAQLQGQGLEEAVQQIGNVVNQAGVQAAQNQIQTPYNRVNAQAGAAQQGITYQDQLRQQAISNRQIASNPALLSHYSNLRDRTTTQQGQSGSFLGAVQGGLTGGATGFGQGLGAQSSLDLGNYYRRLGGGLQTGAPTQSYTAPFQFQSKNFGEL